MKSLSLICSFVLLAGCQRTPPPTPTAPSGPMTIAVPSQGAYLGSYVDFGDTEDDVTIEAIEKYEKLVGKHLAIVASSSYWGEQTFPRENLERISRHGSAPLVYWSPWDKPYEQEKGPDRFSLTAILEGKWDAYIDRWGDGAKAFGKPFFVSFCHEMNGEWFPWSGTFYGGENGGPEVFKKAWRHVADRVRARGANNVLWVFQANNYSASRPTGKYRHLKTTHPSNPGSGKNHRAIFLTLRTLFPAAR